MFLRLFTTYYLFNNFTLPPDKKEIICIDLNNTKGLTFVGTDENGCITFVTNQSQILEDQIDFFIRDLFLIFFCLFLICLYF